MENYYSNLEKFSNNINLIEEDYFYEPENKNDLIIFKNIIKYPFPNNETPTGAPPSISHIDENNFIYEDNVVSYVNIPRSMRINNGEKNQVFNLRIYSKETYYKKNNFNRKKFVEILFKKANIDLNQLFMKHNSIFNYWTTPQKLISHFNAIYPRITHSDSLRIINENYEFIMEKIREKIINDIDIYDIAANYIFNKSNFYYNYIINIFTRSIDQILKYKNIKINVDFFRYLLESAFIFNSSNNFGIVYQTIKYMSKQSLYSETSITNTLRKLEFLGCISYVVGDAPYQHNAVEEYLNKIKLSNEENSEQIFNHYRRVYGLPLSNKFNYLLFPVFNFHIMINYVLNHFSEQLLKDSSYEIINHIIKSQSELFIERFNSDIIVEIFKDLKFNLPINEKLIKPKYKRQPDIFNLYTGYEKYKPYIKEETQIGYPIVNISNVINFFKDRTITTYKTQTLIEDCYLMSDWVKTIFKNNHYKTTGEYPNKINISTYPIDDIFINNLSKDFKEEDKFMYYIEPHMDYIGLLQNMLNYYFKGMWLYYVYKYNGSKMLKNIEINNLKNDINLNNFQITDELTTSINYRLNRIIKEQKLDRDEIFNYSIPLFKFLKRIFFKINNRKDFIYLLWKTFTNSSKSPILYLNKMYKLLIWIDNDLCFHQHKKEIN